MRSRIWLFSVAATVIVVWGFGAIAGQDQTQRKKAPEKGLAALGGDLLSAQALEKLKLTNAQQEKFVKLSAEFQQKQKDLKAKMEAARKDRDRSKLQEADQTLQKLRPEYLTRVESILTDAQKKTLDEVRSDAPAARTRPGVQPTPPAGATPSAGQILPPQLQERLNLTAEQKKKLDELQKEVDSKLRNLLTEEQRKLLEPAKENPPKKKRPADRSQTGAAPGNFTNYNATITCTAVRSNPNHGDGPVADGSRALGRSVGPAVDAEA